MSRFAVVDLSNLFHRARHGAMAPDPETKIGLGLLIVFRSLRKMHRELKIDHIVFAVDQSSWRYAAYPNYKGRRKLERSIATPREQEENTQFFAALDRLADFLDAKTRCTVLRKQGIEGDDFVARWIMRHPDDEHVIVSGDSDFVQLIAPNVSIYDAINQRMIRHDSVTDDRGRRLEFSVNPKDGKVKVGKPQDDFVPEDEWWKKALFVKIIRGDAGDSIFAAYPGVRYEGKKCSIRAAWEDRHAQGYDWNNLMFQTWDKLLGTNEDGEKQTMPVRVLDEFRLNESLIDLTKQPDDVKRLMDAAIDEAVQRPLPTTVGVHFLRYCATENLPSLSNEAAQHAAYLNSAYPRRNEQH